MVEMDANATLDAGTPISGTTAGLITPMPMPMTAEEDINVGALGRFIIRKS